MRHLRNPYVQVGLWTFAITLVVTVIVWSVPWQPEEASTQAGPIDTLYDVLALISAFVFALVVSVLMVAVVHFRKRRHDDLSDGDADPRQHPARGRLDRDPGDPDGRERPSTAASCSPTSRRPKANTADDRGHRRAVRVDLRVRRRSSFRPGELHLVADTPVSLSSCTPRT